MIRPTPVAPPPSVAQRKRPRHKHLPSAPPVQIYGRAFWFAYGSNLLFMTAVALLYRYADFVSVLGGGELELGWIVGFGTVGSLLTRVFIGTAIDRRGAPLIWLFSSLLFAVSCFGHLLITDIHGPAVYALRFVFTCAIASLVGGSMTFVGAQAPRQRLAEVIGMLGTSGFLGALLGTQLGDVLLGSHAITLTDVNSMFIAAGCLALLATGMAFWATRGHSRPVVAEDHPAAWGVLREFFSVPVFVVGVAMGAGLVLLQTFLRTYTAELDIPRMGAFFVAYSLAAVITRVVTRRWPERFGPVPMIVAGMLTLAASQLLLLPVRQEWHLIVSGAVFGFSHAVLFPSIVAAGTIGFPARHRGLATTMILSSWDLGQLFGAPACGAVLYNAAHFGLPPYPTLFIATAALLVAVTGYFVAVNRQR